uniref:Uncharacterized protein n=1 Tax=viral metagenome TaxID=1070528 RepID=A0A6C0LN41_9ZZZZ
MVFIKTNIPYEALSLEENEEFKSYLMNEDHYSLLKLVNKKIAYNKELMVGIWSYGDIYLPSGKKPSVEPKGKFVPNSYMFKSLDKADIIISHRYNDTYVKELRVQFVPLPL